MGIKRCIAISCFLSLLSGAVDAAKLYKIKDKDGNITYSQFPPEASEDETKEVEDLSINSGGATLLTRSGDDSYCGEIRLPKKSKYKKNADRYFDENVARQTTNWRSSLKRLEEQAVRKSKSLQKTNDYYDSRAYKSSRSDDYQARQAQQYHSGLSSDIERMRDLRCAIAWSKKIDRDEDKAYVDTSAERDRLEGIKAKLEATINTKCGAIPKYDPTDPVVVRKRKDWYYCSDQYRNDIETIEMKLKKL